jgi:hypothetical protein
VPEPASAGKENTTESAGHGFAVAGLVAPALTAVFTVTAEAALVEGAPHSAETVHATDSVWPASLAIDRV